MASLRAVLLVLVPVVMIWGSTACRSAEEASAATSLAPGHAICPVCAADGDLACQDVKIRPDTPSTTRDGVAYYFCSSECRRKFEARPEAYLTR